MSSQAAGGGPRARGPRAIALPRLGGENVQDAVEEVEHDPAGVRAALDADGKHAGLLLHPQPHLVDDRPRLALVAGRADRQEVGIGNQGAHVEDDDLIGLFGVGELSQTARERLRCRHAHE